MNVTKIYYEKETLIVLSLDTLSIQEGRSGEGSRQEKVEDHSI